MSAHKLPELPYAHDALEPHIDARTMEIHHGKHHAAYVKNLNAALEKAPELQGLELGTLLADLSKVPDAIRTAVRNNGGGVYNHSLFWPLMGPGKGGSPVGQLGDAVKKQFGAFDAFQDQFSKAAATRFGSGWAWLSLTSDGKLVVHSTANQDSPLSEGKRPILTLDVWEHAYYLNYQNRRPDYIQAWWNVVNWEAANDNYVKALG